MKIFLLEGTDKTLGAMSERSSRDSLRYLQKLGVTVITGTMLKEYDGKTAILQNGETIETTMVIWAAGVKGNIPEGIDRGDRKSTRLNSSHVSISYAVFCLKKKTRQEMDAT